MDNVQARSVLCVDDEPGVLELLTNVLRREFVVTTALDGQAGFELFRREGPFAIVLSDLRMPGLDGIAFLSRVCQIAPETRRVLLTAYADLDAAIGAINEGHVFRLLLKPCPLSSILSTLREAAEQYQRLVDDRRAFDQAQYGWVNAIDRVLERASPVASRRAHRARQLAADLADPEAWEDRRHLEAAAILSQAIALDLPPDLLERLYEGLQLSEPEQELINRLPQLAQDALQEIPRLEPIAGILRYQYKRFDGTGPPRGGVRGTAIPWGARALRIIFDYLGLEAQGFDAALALSAMRGRLGWYDVDLLEAFARQLGVPEPGARVLELPVQLIGTGMILADDVKTRSGLLLVPRGREVTEALAERIRSLPRHLAVVEPIRVVLRQRVDRDAPLELSAS